MYQHHKVKYFILITILFFTCFLAGCLPSPYYQRVETIPNATWLYNYKPSFSLDVDDTTTNYQTYFIIRHTQAYPFNNIWLLLSLKKPGDSVIKKQRVNIVLAEPSGKWMGRGRDEIWEQRMYIKLNDSMVFNKIGTYQVLLEQNMRINPLPEVLNVGLRVEKAGVRVIK